MFHYRSFHSFVHQESQVTERRKAESKSPQHKYLRHSISLRLYKFHFTGSISAYHAYFTSPNATLAQSKTLCSFHFVPPIPMLFSSALLPAHNALLHILRLRLPYLSGACSIAFCYVHPFAGKAAYCLSHRPSWLSH